MLPASASRWLKDIAIAIVCVFGGIYLLMAIGSGAFSSKSPKKTADVSSVPTGSEGRLSAGGNVIPIAIDEETLPEASGSTEELPAADYVVMGSSFCHFYRHEGEILAKMLSAARCGVIISEPVRNLSTCAWRVVGGLANRLTNPGVGEFQYRFDLDSFRSFAERHGADRFLHQPGQRNAVAVFVKNRADMRVTADWQGSELGPDGDRPTRDSSPYGV